MHRRWKVTPGCVVPSHRRPLVPEDLPVLNLLDAVIPGSTQDRTQLAFFDFECVIAWYKPGRYTFNIAPGSMSSTRTRWRSLPARPRNRYEAFSGLEPGNFRDYSMTNVPGSKVRASGWPLHLRFSQAKSGPDHEIRELPRHGSHFIFGINPGAGHQPEDSG